MTDWGPRMTAAAWTYAAGADRAERPMSPSSTPKIIGRQPVGSDTRCKETHEQHDTSRSTNAVLIVLGNQHQIDIDVEVASGTFIQ